MRVVVTRPAQDAQRWVERLRERGHAAIALPLLAIGPAPQPSLVTAMWHDLHRYRALMFVSANAVRGWFALRGTGAWPVDTRAWAPGPATAEALLAAGVPAASVDVPAAEAEQFDSESLWQRVAGQLAAGDRLLVVRGADAQGRGQGREWLAEQLSAAGVKVDAVSVYARAAPVWDAPQLAAARDAARDGSIWLFSSSEAAAHLPRLLPAQDWSAARAIATHPRIVQSVRALGFGRVDPSRPAFDEVVASIESAG